MLNAHSMFQVRVGSETHMISDSNSRRTVPHISRIGSEPFVQQHFASVPIARLATAQSGILHRVASESHMRTPMQPCELSLSRADLEDMQVCPCKLATQIIAVCKSGKPVDSTRQRSRGASMASPDDRLPCRWTQAWPCLVCIAP